MKRGMQLLAGTMAFATAPVFAGVMTLSGTIYDHTISEADFEDGISGLKTGMVATTLGMDGLPDYIGTDGYGEVDSAA